MNRGHVLVGSVCAQHIAESTAPAGGTVDVVPIKTRISDPDVQSTSTEYAAGVSVRARAACPSVTVWRGRRYRYRWRGIAEWRGKAKSNISDTRSHRHGPHARCTRDELAGEAPETHSPLPKLRRRGDVFRIPALTGSSPDRSPRAPFVHTRTHHVPGLRSRNGRLISASHLVPRPSVLSDPATEPCLKAWSLP